MSVQGCVHRHVGIGGEQGFDLDPLELELQAPVSSLTWTLEIEFGSSAGAGLTLNH